MDIILILGVPPPDFSGYPGPVGDRVMWQVITQRAILIMFGVMVYSPFLLWVFTKHKQRPPGD